MSRIGNLPIPIPDGVEIKIDKANNVIVKGPKGELEQEVDSVIKLNVKDGNLLVKRSTDQQHHRAKHGMFRSLLANMVEGVTNGYEKQLEIIGVGFRARMKGNNIRLELGFSHPIHFSPPDEVIIETPSDRTILVKGIDKQLVGQVTAKIRSFRPPEPYKGKGIRYVDEYVRRKAGKAAAK